MRVYLPSTLPAVADALAKGESGPPPLEAFAVTPALREAYASGDDEELEYVAMLTAARRSLRLLADDPDAPQRRAVLAADVPRAALVSGHIDATEAEADVAAAAAAAAAADAGDEDAAFTVDSAEGHELAWYAVQELEYLSD